MVEVVDEVVVEDVMVDVRGVEVAMMKMFGCQSPSLVVS
jgi:hypothetical protein